MTAAIVPFPLANRRSFILRQARYASELNPDAAERYIQQQIKVQRDAMHRKGVQEPAIAREVSCLEASIRAVLIRSASGGVR
ncbi:DUF6074 family protein [Bradyrhizobium sp. JYMT SZCCT0428]|uniref:DUF6074 family protein n=1 Tax=Bradyrhizobium sp. JYMT SZCCT0428 TaxID=2807673 RepID=UPI00390890AE